MRQSLPVSLIIPCFNRPEQTKNLLDSLSGSKFACQIILIDDCSFDDIKKIADGYDFPDLIYYRNESNKGPAYSRNMGIKLSKYDYLAFTDNDCVVTDNWLPSLYDSIRLSGDNIAGVGGKVIAKNNDLISLYYIYHKILDPWYYNGQFLYLVTANAIFKKEALLKVNCFDESVKIAGGEDPGMCFKLINAGYGFAYNPEAIIVHDFPKGIINFIKTFYRYGLGCSFQSKKYFKEIKFISNDKFAGING